MSVINSILKENGLRNLEKIAAKMDELIERKWEELEEAEMGSSKDIADLLAMGHKMRMDTAKLIHDDSKKTETINQRNTQVNVYGEGNYGDLMKKLIEG